MKLQARMALIALPIFVAAVGTVAGIQAGLPDKIAEGIATLAACFVCGMIAPFALTD